MTLTDGEAFAIVVSGRTRWALDRLTHRQAALVAALAWGAAVVTIGGIQRIRKEAAEAWLAENETRGSTIH